MKFLCVLALTALLIEKGAAATCFTAGFVTCGSCGGSCTVDNGCSCADGIETCLPDNTQCMTGDNTCCPTGYYWHPNIACCSETINCIPACLSDEYCANVSQVATCACNNSFYANANESSLMPTVKCESTLMTISLSKCLLESLGYDSGSLLLNNASDACISTYSDVINNTRFEFVQGKTLTDWCGNVMTMDASKVYYTNTLHVGIQNKTVITTNPLNLNFTCSYNLTMQTSLATAFRPVVSTVNLTVNGEGSVTTTMAAYFNPDYTNPITATDEVPVASNIYLGVFSDYVDIANFALRVEDCFATPDGDANNVNKVFLVSGGCPANDGVDTVVEANGDSLESRIRVSVFAFRDQALVYVTCNVRLCSKNATCTGCNLGRAAGNGDGTLQVQFNLQGDYLYTSSGSYIDISWDCAGQLFTCTFVL